MAKLPFNFDNLIAKLRLEERLSGGNEQVVKDCSMVDVAQLSAIIPIKTSPKTAVLFSLPLYKKDPRDLSTEEVQNEMMGFDIKRLLIEKIGNKQLVLKVAISEKDLTYNRFFCLVMYKDKNMAETLYDVTDQKLLQ